MTFEEKKALLVSIEKTTKDFLATAPAGLIKVTRIKNHYRFYATQEGQNHYRYLDKDSTPLVKSLAYKRYYLEMTKVLKEIRKNPLIVLDDHDLFEKLGNVYGRMNRELQKYIEPFVLPDDLFIEQWFKKQGPANTISFGNSEYYTANHERVRSKSELIIADRLKNAGIPYKYEAELVLSNGIRYFPDFTILDISTRQEIYIEHCGMMDNPEYRASFYKRIANYAIGGITTGKNLVLFFEDSNSSLNTLVVDKVLSQYKKHLRLIDRR